MAFAEGIAFKFVSHAYYLSPHTLKAWDMLLRPLSAVLIRMVQKLNETDCLPIKTEWVETVRPFLCELYDLDRKSDEQRGCHFGCLDKV